MHKYLFQLLIFWVCGFTSVHSYAQENFTITFRHKVGKQELVLFDSLYTNSFNEPFIVNKFKYYISKITIHTPQQIFTNNQHFLIDANDINTHSISFPTSIKHITALEFTIGVDSLKNTEGVQTGVLDPMNGMFWTWNSGYIYAKLEGQSDSSKAASNYFTYHIGGYKKNENAVQTVHLKMPETLAYKRNIVINADVLKWFDGVSPIRIAQTQICHQPGKLAQQIARNYATMFSIATIE